MSARKLKTAVIGLTDFSIKLLEAAAKSELFQIEAVGGRDPEAAEELSRNYGCKFFDDFRQLIVNNELDVLIAAGPTHQIDEYIRAAMQKNIHILKVAPPGKSFEQAAEYVRLARSKNVRYTIVNPNRFSSAYSDLKSFVQAEGIEKFSLITAACNVEPYIDRTDQRWMSDPKLAGGGTLLYDGYEMIDQLVMNFKIPQKIYALTSNRAPDKQQRLSLTEDAAVVTMRFSDTLSANITVSRMFGPAVNVMRLHAKDKCFTIAGNLFTIRDNSGEVIKEIKYDPAKEEALTKMLTNFAEHVLEPEQNNLFADELADLNNMAVIDSAYLSARTGMPEDPARILDMIEIESMNIWGSGGKRII
jgi:predicted dehydrogenase